MKWPIISDVVRILMMELESNLVNLDLNFQTSSPALLYSIGNKLRIENDMHLII